MKNSSTMRLWELWGPNKAHYGRVGLGGVAGLLLGGVSGVPGPAGSLKGLARGEGVVGSLGPFLVHSGRSLRGWLVRSGRPLGPLLVHSGASLGKLARH